MPTVTVGSPIPNLSQPLQIKGWQNPNTLCPWSSQLLSAFSCTKLLWPLPAAAELQANGGGRGGAARQHRAAAASSHPSFIVCQETNQRDDNKSVWKGENNSAVSLKGLASVYCTNPSVGQHECGMSLQKLPTHIHPHTHPHPAPSDDSPHLSTGDIRRNLSTSQVCGTSENSVPRSRLWRGALSF